MLVLGFDIPLWVALISIAAVLLYWHGTSTYDAFKKMGVPHLPVYIPYVGNMGLIFSSPLVEIDQEAIKKFGKVFGLFHGKQPMLQVADAELAKEFTIREFSTFMNRRDLVSEDTAAGNHIGAIRDDHWKHIRSVLTPTFTSGKLKQMYPVINSTADKFVKHLDSTSAKPIVIKDYTSGYTMEVIASTAFGLDIDAQSTTDHPFIYHSKGFFGIPKDDTLITKIKLFVSLLVVFFVPRKVKNILGLIFDMSFIGHETIVYFNDLMDQILNRTQAELQKRNDFISLCSDKLVDLTKVEKDSLKTTNGKLWSTKGLSKKDIVANAAIFLSAGYETTASTLQYFFYIMSLHPEIQERLHDSISEVVDEHSGCTYEELKKLEYLDWCVNECLRMFPPGSRLEREASSDCTIKGMKISKGTGVEVLIYSIHHDPDYWPNPDTFDPNRFAPENKTDIQQQAYLPFGAGNRKCIAERLALLETKVAIVKALMAFRFEKCAETPEIEDLEFKSGAGLLIAKQALKVSAVPRKRSANLV